MMDLVAEMLKTLDSSQPQTEVMRSSREMLSLKCPMQRSMMAKTLEEEAELMEELSAESSLPGKVKVNLPPFAFLPPAKEALSLHSILHKPARRLRMFPRITRGL